MRYVIFTLIVSLSITGCYVASPVNSYPATAMHFTDEQPSLLSYGMVKRGLMPGRTTQADVLNKFGAPNNMTYQTDGQEMWIYDQVVSEASSDASGESSGVGLGFFGLNDPVLGFRADAGQYNRKATTRSVLKTLTVILTFDSRGVLSDVSARRGGY